MSTWGLVMLEFGEACAPKYIQNKNSKKLK